MTQGNHEPQHGPASGGQLPPASPAYPWGVPQGQQPTPPPSGQAGPGLRPEQMPPPQGPPLVPAPQYGQYAPGYAPTAPGQAVGVAPGQVPGQGWPPVPPQAWGQPPYPGYAPQWQQPAWQPKPKPMPAASAEYQHVLRGPRRAWWRPIVSLLLLGLLYLAIVGTMTALWAVGVAATGGSVGSFFDELGSLEITPTVFAYMNATLAAGIPAVLLANRWAHGIRSGYTHSVAGRFRWRWFAECLVWLLPLWAAFLALGWLIEGRPAPAPHEHLWVMLALVLLTTPLQSAGEEYVFRGWFLQNVGAWLPSRWVALLLPMVPSVALFALAHGSLDLWVLLDLGLFALVACVLAWRTGGLEAAIAMHSVNNMAVMAFTLVMGGFEDGFVDTETTGAPTDVLITLGLQGVALAILWWRARRRGVQRVTSPDAAGDEPPAGTGAPGAGSPGALGGGAHWQNQAGDPRLR